MTISKPALKISLHYLANTLRRSQISGYERHQTIKDELHAEVECSLFHWRKKPLLVSFIVLSNQIKRKKIYIKSMSKNRIWISELGPLTVCSPAPGMGKLTDDHLEPVH